MKNLIEWQHKYLLRLHRPAAVFFLHLLHLFLCFFFLALPRCRCCFLYIGVSAILCVLAREWIKWKVTTAKRREKFKLKNNKTKNKSTPLSTTMLQDTTPYAHNCCEIITPMDNNTDKKQEEKKTKTDWLWALTTRTVYKIFFNEKMASVFIKSPKRMLVWIRISGSIFRVVHKAQPTTRKNHRGNKLGTIWAMVDLGGPILNAHTKQAITATTHSPANQWDKHGKYEEKKKK